MLGGIFLAFSRVVSRVFRAMGAMLVLALMVSGGAPKIKQPPPLSSRTLSSSLKHKDSTYKHAKNT